MNENNKFIKDNLLPENIDIDETDSQIEIKYIAIIKIVKYGSNIIVNIGGKSISFLLGSLIIMLYGVKIIPKQVVKFYDMLADQFESTSSIKDSEMKTGISKLIKSGDLGLAQQLIKGQKHKDET